MRARFIEIAENSAHVIIIYNRYMAKQTLRTVAVIGDAHGDYHSLAAVLIHAGLLNAELEWTGGRTVLVQTGDILDRGTEPLHIDKLFDFLKPLARKAGGDVIRLTGNHELEILRRNYFITSLPYYQIEAFRAKLIDAVAKNVWQAAYACRGFLITHAGVCSELYAHLKQELAPAKATESMIAAHINKIFKEAVAAGNYKHPIFNVSARRGGSDAYGGIFWEDLSSLFSSHDGVPFKQIVGHSTVREITLAPGGKIVAVDVGMKRVFEGGFEYLRIKNSKKIDIIGLE